MLKEARKKCGISQAELARRAGVPQGVISYIECGRTKHPRIDTLQAIAAALQCTVDDLVQGGGDRETGRAVS